MENIGVLFSYVWQLFSSDMTIYNFTFSFADVFIWSAVAGCMILFIRNLIF